MKEWFRPKDPKELGYQLNATSRYLKEKTGQSLPPPLVDPTEVVLLGESEAKERFGTKRYEIFVDTLRTQYQDLELSENKIRQTSRWLRTLNNIDEYIANQHALEPASRVLYPEQIEVFEHLGRLIANGGTEGYVKLPTAFGKTIIFTEFIKALNGRTVVAVPTIEIVDQTELMSAELSPELTVGKVYYDEENFDEQVTIITYHSLVRHLERGARRPEEEDLRPDEIDLLVLDEVHHAIGLKTSWVISQFPNAIKLGFTATPVYSPTRFVGQIINKEVYNKSIKEAVEEGTLCGFRVWVALTDMDLSGVKVSSLTEDYDPSQLLRVINNTSRNQAAVDLYQENFAGESAVVFCVSVQHAKNVAELFKSRGIAAEAVYGNMKGRERVIETFRRGEIQVLCNMQLLTEGFDAPKASVCINLRPTLSYVVAEQRGGRVLRRDPNNPLKEATIIDFIDKGGDKMAVSFVEVAEAVKVEPINKPVLETELVTKETTQSTHNGSLRTGIDNSQVEGVTLITDVQEIMRLATQARESREPQEHQIGFSRVFALDLAQEYEVKHGMIYRRLRRLKEFYPSHFFGGRNSYYLATPQGMDLLREELKDLQTPRGYTRLMTADIQEQYKIGVETLGYRVNKLSKKYPGHFIRRGTGNPIDVSEFGMEVLTRELNDLRPKEGYSPLPTKELSSEYQVSLGAVGKNARTVAAEYPDEFIIRADKKPSVFITEKGLHLVKVHLSTTIRATRLTPPENYTPIPVKELAEESGLHVQSVYQKIKRLRSNCPNYFMSMGGKQPILASPEGIDMLRQALNSSTTLPDGFRVIETTSLAERFNFSQPAVLNHVQRLSERFPAEFKRQGKGRPIIATAKGISLLNSALSETEQ